METKTKTSPAVAREQIESVLEDVALTTYDEFVEHLERLACRGYAFDSATIEESIAVAREFAMREIGHRATGSVNPIGGLIDAVRVRAALAFAERLEVAVTVYRTDEKPDWMVDVIASVKTHRYAVTHRV